MHAGIHTSLSYRIIYACTVRRVCFYVYVYVSRHACSFVCLLSTHLHSQLYSLPPSSLPTHPRMHRESIPQRVRLKHLPRLILLEGHKIRRRFRDPVQNLWHPSILSWKLNTRLIPESRAKTQTG